MARMTSVAISYLKNFLPSQKNSLAHQTRWLSFAFSSILSATFRLCFSTVTLNSRISPRELGQIRPIIPLQCCQILPHSISFHPLPSGGCLSLYPRSHQPLASIVEKKQSETGPHAHLHPMETGIWLHIFTPCYLSCYPAHPPSPFTAILLPSVLLERKLQLWALYLNHATMTPFHLPS